MLGLHCEILLIITIINWGFTYNMPSKPHDNPVRQGSLLSLFYRYRKWCSEKPNDLPKAPQLINDRARIWIHRQSSHCLCFIKSNHAARLILGATIFQNHSSWNCLIFPHHLVVVLQPLYCFDLGNCLYTCLSCLILIFSASLGVADSRMQKPEWWGKNSKMGWGQEEGHFLVHLLPQP